METEFGIGSEMNKVFSDFESAHHLMAKSTAGPDFSSRETDSMFILSAHLKGYRGEDIKVEIVKDWTILTISGEYPIKESVMVETKVIKKETTRRRFKKAFRIPPRVVLNQIKARFNKYESLLTISMPKSLKEHHGIVIEEVKADDFVHSDLSLQIRIDEVSDGDFSSRKEGTDQLLAAEATQEADPLLVREETRPELEGRCSEVEGRDVEESGELRGVDEATQETDKVLVGEETRRKEGDKLNNIDESKRGDKPRSIKLCACCKYAGSALLVSLVVIVFHFIRSQKQSNKKKSKS
ncbi:hypothetical protein LguiA_018352 [Lonicera macranthoides]